MDGMFEEIQFVLPLVTRLKISIVSEHNKVLLHKVTGNNITELMKYITTMKTNS